MPGSENGGNIPEAAKQKAVEAVKDAAPFFQGHQPANAPAPALLPQGELSLIDAYEASLIAEADAAGPQPPGFGVGPFPSEDIDPAEPIAPLPTPGADYEPEP